MMERSHGETDWTVNLNGIKISVRKSILVKKSKYFRKLAKTHSTEVAINYDVDIDIFNLILNYIYTDEIEVSTANMKRIYDAAGFFMLEDLKELCLSRVDSKTVDEVHSLAKENNRIEISKIAFDFKVKHFERILKTRSFLNWKLESVEEILQSDRVVVSGENKILQFLISWINHDFKERSKNSDKLLGSIRFKHLKQSDLTKTGEKNRQFAISIPRELMVKASAPRQYHKGVYMYFTNRNHTEIFPNMLARYCPIDGTVTQLAPIKRDYCIIVINEKLHAGNKVYNDLTNQWESATNMSKLIEYSKFWHRCYFKGKVYAFGDMATGLLIAAYSIVSNTWETGEVPLALRKLRIRALLNCGDSIYLVQFSNYSRPANLIRFTPPPDGGDISSPGNWSEIECPYDLAVKFIGVAYKTKLIFLKRYINGHLIVYDTATNEFKECLFFTDDKMYDQIAMYNDYICLFDSDPISSKKSKSSKEVALVPLEGRTTYCRPRLEYTFPVKLLNADLIDKPLFPVETSVPYMKTFMDRMSVVAYI